MATRSKNAGQRRRVLANLCAAHRMLDGLKQSWDVTGRIYVEPAERTDRNAWSRERREDEYPENRAAEWAHLYTVTDALIKGLTELRETARNRYFEIKEAGDQR